MYCGCQGYPGLQQYFGLYYADAHPYYAYYSPMYFASPAGHWIAPPHLQSNFYHEGQQKQQQQQKHPPPPNHPSPYQGQPGFQQHYHAAPPCGCRHTCGPPHSSLHNASDRRHSGKASEEKKPHSQPPNEQAKGPETPPAEHSAPKEDKTPQETHDKTDPKPPSAPPLQLVAGPQVETKPVSARSPSQTRGREGSRDRTRTRSASPSAPPEELNMQDVVDILNAPSRRSQPSPCLFFKPVSTAGITGRSKHGRPVSLALNELFGNPIEPGGFQAAVKNDAQKKQLLGAALDMTEDWPTGPLSFTFLPVQHQGKWMLMRYELDTRVRPPAHQIVEVFAVRPMPKRRRWDSRPRPNADRDMTEAEGVLVRDYNGLSELLHADRKQCVRHSPRLHLAKGKLDTRVFENEPLTIDWLSFNLEEERGSKTRSSEEDLWTRQRVMAMMVLLAHSPSLAASMLEDIMRGIDEETLESMTVALSRAKGQTADHQREQITALAAQLTHHYRYKP